MYSYAVAGANLFGQWFTDDMVIEGFKRVSKKCPEKHFDLDKARLVHATWSYNIFEIGGIYYVSGSWLKMENQLVILPLPVEFPKDCTNMLVSGNDNYIVVVDGDRQVVYVIDLKFESSPQRMELYPEVEINAEHIPKKVKKNNGMVMVEMTNNAAIYMSHINGDVKVYAGILPHIIETNHVMGRIIDVRCGYEHYVLLTDMGKVYTWGNGRRLQLGHGGIDDVPKPREVRALAGFNIKKIRAGGWHTAIVSEFGDLYKWGWNDVGQLGIKSKAMRRKELQDGPSDKKKKTHPISTVVDIYDEELNFITLNVIDVCCGSKHTVIMLSDYSIWAAGSNEYGQLGLPVKDYTHIEHYVKVHQGTKDTVLRCGPWTTIIQN